MTENKRKALEQLLAGDYETRLEALATKLFEECASDDESPVKKGRAFVQALLNDSVEDMLMAICGWSSNYLLKNSLCIRNGNEYVIGENEDGSIAAIACHLFEDYDFMELDCTIDPNTFEVKLDEEELTELSEKEREVINKGDFYIAFYDMQFGVVLKDDLKDDVAFWYDPAKNAADKDAD